jgi:ASC-1-like (ASCH) protein|tara:strand:- start:5027 stop:5365 length:339 start_codon:yes stop_codon:yes gene_type:complete
MSIHAISINKNALNNIKFNKKKIEGRLKRGYFINMEIKINDKIIFYNYDDKYIISVKDIIEYNNLYEYLKNEKISHILPHLDNININDAINHYRKLYSEENLKNYKFLAIKF